MTKPNLTIDTSVKACPVMANYFKNAAQPRPRSSMENLDSSAKACPVTANYFKDSTLSRPPSLSPTSAAQLEDLVRGHKCFIVPIRGYTTEYEAKFTWPEGNGHKIFCKSPTKSTGVKTLPFLFPDPRPTNYETEYKEHFSPRFTPGKAFF